MRFLTDQDVYETTVKYLRELGHDVLRARDAGLALATDEQLLRYACGEKRIFVTRDKGFGAYVFLAFQEHSGVILLRMDPLTANAVHQELSRLLSKHTEAKLQKCFVVVEPGRHRIRLTQASHTSKHRSHGGGCANAH